MSVLNAPGRMQLTRTLGASASANPTVNALSPAFAAAYGNSPTLASSEPIVLTLMIEPEPASYMRWPARTPNRNGPLRFTPTTLSKRSSVIDVRSGYSGDIPALFTNTSHLPKCSYTVSTSWLHSSQWPTCTATGNAVRPVSASTSLASASQLSSLRLAMTTSAPAAANPLIIDRPIPRLPPVTTATL